MTELLESKPEEKNQRRTSRESFQSLLSTRVTTRFKRKRRTQPQDSCTPLMNSERKYTMLPRLSMDQFKMPKPKNLPSRDYIDSTELTDLKLRE